MPAPRPVMVRILEKMRWTPDCWEWTAAKSWCGYGQIGVNRKVKYAHRVFYELVVGPVPDGCELDHLCRNPGCLRPSHLEPVPHRVNMQRSPEMGKANRAKTHCPRGHAYDEENTFWTKVGGRKCRTCHNMLRRQRRKGSV